jgi:hypothetical protein
MMKYTLLANFLAIGVADTVCLALMGGSKL